MLFLIEYDRMRGKLTTLRSFESSERTAAEHARLSLEIALNRDRIEREVVLLEAETEEALRQTHSRYFEDLVALAQRGVQPGGLSK